MIEVKLSELAEIVGGKLIGPDAVVTGSVETDSRLISQGSLFIAKPGEVTDGHNFAANAQVAGAVGIVVERELNDLKVGQIQVENSVIALGAIAAWLVSELKKAGRLKVVGITGSNGKTSTKNMLRSILSKHGNAIAPIESYNNEVGAPISILKATRESDYLVVELGAGGVGSIRYLAEICKPDIGVELKVGLAHVGEFGGIEKTFEIKSELVKELTNQSVAVLNYDDGYVRSMAALTDAKVVWFGTSQDANYRATDIATNITGTTFTLTDPMGNSRKVLLRILGEHQVMNASAALSVAAELGIDLTSAVSSLEEMDLAERWRMQLLAGPNGSLVINDAYNASPDSMKAALQTLATLGKQGHRTIAILGEMAELGDQSPMLHDEIGRFVVRLNIDQLIVVGIGAKLIHLGAMQEGSWDGESKFVESIDEALQLVRGLLVQGDIVLVKSSKSADLRFLGDALAEVNG